MYSGAVLSQNARAVLNQDASPRLHLTTRVIFDLSGQITTNDDTALQRCNPPAPPWRGARRHLGIVVAQWAHRRERIEQLGTHGGRERWLPCSLVNGETALAADLIMHLIFKHLERSSPAPRRLCMIWTRFLQVRGKMTCRKTRIKSRNVPTNY